MFCNNAKTEYYVTRNLLSHYVTVLQKFDIGLLMFATLDANYDLLQCC